MTNTTVEIDQSPTTFEAFIEDRSRVNAVMNDIYKRGDRMMCWLVALHFGLSMIFAAIYQTWLLSIVVAVVGAGMFFLSVSLLPRQRATRIIAGISLQTFVALHIYQLHGLPEMHFFFFTAFTAMVVYEDGLAMWPGTILIIGQHILFAVLQNSGVNLYFFEDPYIGVRKLFFHFGIAILQVVLCGVWSHFLRRQALMEAFQRERLEVASKAERIKSALLDEALTELTTSHKALVRAEKLAAVGQLAASVGHELRNPLAAVRNANTYIGKRLASAEQVDPKVPQFVKVIEREVTACTKIISDLLDFARERQPVLLPCTLRALVEDALTVVPESKVRLANDVPDDLPVAWLDKDYFRQVLINLVQNAIESIPPDREGGEVVISAEGGGDREWTISVRDNGVGIPEEQLDQIFEPLFTTKIKGTGLGLAIVAGVVKAHGGSIRAVSKPGEGAEFVIKLPSSAQRKAA